MEQDENTRFQVRSFMKKRKMDLVFLFLGTLIGIYFNWSIVEIVIFLTFLWSILGPISSRILVGPAVFFLCLTPILLTLDREKQAEEFAIYAYFFLVMSVIRAIIEIRAEKEEETLLYEDS